MKNQDINRNQNSQSNLEDEKQSDFNRRIEKDKSVDETSRMGNVNSRPGQKESRTDQSKMGDQSRSSESQGRSGQSQQPINR